MEEANTWVFQMSRAVPSLHKMGTTLCCLYWGAEGIAVGHAGDSRVYQISPTLQRVLQLTEDHSQLAEWKRGGGVENPPPKHLITKALGTSPRSPAEVKEIVYSPGDLFLLCSDGVSDVLSEEDFLPFFQQDDALPLIAEKIINKAKLKGSPDNMTVLLVHEDNLFRQQLDDPARPRRIAGDVAGAAGAASEPF
jgi:protein phosphatase